jgi:hypothetical protein
MWYSETFGTIKTPRGITVNGLQHPQNIFRLWSKEKLAEIGIRPARVVTPDNRYYNTGRENYELVGDEWVISYDTTEKDVEQLKEQLIEKISAHVGSLLSPSDWRVIREADGGTAMSEEWTTYRHEVRQHGNALEAGVEAFASLDAIKNFQNHPVTEVRYTSTYDDEGVETIGPETETHDRTVDKTTWGWPEAPDAEVDPYHVRYL